MPLIRPPTIAPQSSQPPGGIAINHSQTDGLGDSNRHTIVARGLTVRDFCSLQAGGLASEVTLSETQEGGY